MYSVRTRAVAECCGKREEFANEDIAWAWVLDHVHIHHDWDLWDRVNALAKALLDSDKFVTPELNGWDEASSEAKDSWRIQALKNIMRQEER